MPKLPRVSGTQAIHALQRLGFEIVRQRGSHIVLRRGPSGCVVPNHREIKTSTLASVPRLTHATPKEFISAL